MIDYNQWKKIYDEGKEAMMIAVNLDGCTDGQIKYDGKYY